MAIFTSGSIELKDDSADLIFSGSKVAGVKRLDVAGVLRADSALELSNGQIKRPGGTAIAVNNDGGANFSGMITGDGGILQTSAIRASANGGSDGALHIEGNLGGGAGDVFKFESDYSNDSLKLSHNARGANTFEEVLNIIGRNNTNFNDFNIAQFKNSTKLKVTGSILGQNDGQSSGTPFGENGGSPKLVLTNTAPSILANRNFAGIRFARQVDDGREDQGVFDMVVQAGQTQDSTQYDTNVGFAVAGPGANGISIVTDADYIMKLDGGEQALAVNKIKGIGNNTTEINTVEINPSRIKFDTTYGGIEMADAPPALVDEPGDGIVIALGRGRGQGSSRGLLFEAPVKRATSDDVLQTTSHALQVFEANADGQMRTRMRCNFKIMDTSNDEWAQFTDDKVFSVTGSIAAMGDEISFSDGLAKIQYNDGNTSMFFGDASAYQFRAAAHVVDGPNLSIVNMSTNIQNGAKLGQLRFSGLDSGPTPVFGGVIEAIATENWNNGNNEGSRLQFLTKDPGATSNQINFIIDTTYAKTFGKMAVAGDTADSDQAAMGYNATDGVVITGHGTTSDVTLKNTSNEKVLSIMAGTKNVMIERDLITSGSDIKIVAPEGQGAQLRIEADQGDDDVDRWRIRAGQGNPWLSVQTYAAGSVESFLNMKTAVSQNDREFEVLAGDIIEHGRSQIRGRSYTGTQVYSTPPNTNDFQFQGLSGVGSYAYNTNLSGVVAIQGGGQYPGLGKGTGSGLYTDFWDITHSSGGNPSSIIRTPNTWEYKAGGVVNTTKSWNRVQRLTGGSWLITSNQPIEPGTYVYSVYLGTNVVSTQRFADTDKLILEYSNDGGVSYTTSKELQPTNYNDGGSNAGELWTGASSHIPPSENHSHPGTNTVEESDFEFRGTITFSGTASNNMFRFRRVVGSVNEIIEIAQFQMKLQANDGRSPCLDIHIGNSGADYPTQHLARFYELAENLAAGEITIFNNTVTYSAFTGAHPARLNGFAQTHDLVKIVGCINDVGEPVYEIEKTTTAEDPAVLGAYGYESELVNENVNCSVYCVGNGRIKVCDQNGDIGIGDWLCSSDIEGAAMKQSSLQLMNYTAAKSTDIVEWSTVPGTPGQKTKIISCTYHSG